jgi:hypothetical protein
VQRKQEHLLKVAGSANSNRKTIFQVVMGELFRSNTFGDRFERERKDGCFGEVGGSK